MRDDKNLNNALYTKKGIEIYRKLFALIRSPGSENEVVKIVVDSLFEQFPDCRVSYCNVQENNKLHIIYSRQPSGWIDKNGKHFSVGSFYDRLPELRQDQTLIISDLKKFPFMEEFFKDDFKNNSSLALLSHSFDLSEDSGAAIAILSEGPRIWSDESVAVVREVTDLLRLMMREIVARAALRDNETLSKQFAENIQSVFWMTNVQKKKMIYISPAYEQIWGRSCESLYNDSTSFLNAIHPEDRPRIESAITTQSEGKHNEIYRVIKPSGEIRWVKDRAFPVKNDQGEIYRVVGIVEDITEMKELLTRLETTQHQALLNAKFAALGEMASGIAHEINNPLAVIHGLSAQMKEMLVKLNVQDSHILDSLAVIEKNTNRIASVIKGLRTFSRQIEFDKSESVDLIAIMNETLSLFSAKFRHEDISLEVKIPKEPVLVLCRASEISQVILHLLKNAHDAAVEQPNKWISAGIIIENDFVNLFVEDSGMQISKEIQEKIFQPFFTTKDVGKGMGLGLSISKGIVESHSGKLYLDTKAKHTRFVVELPAGK